MKRKAKAALTRQAMAEVYVDKARKLDGGVAIQLLTFADTIKKCIRSLRPCGLNPCPWCLAKRIECEREKVLRHLNRDADDKFRGVLLRVPRPVPARDLPESIDALRRAVGKLTHGKKVWAKHLGPWAARMRVRPLEHQQETSAGFVLSVRFIIADGGNLDRDDLDARWLDLLLGEGLVSSNNGPVVSMVNTGPLGVAARRLCGTARKTLNTVATMMPTDVPAYLASLKSIHRPILGCGTVPPGTVANHASYVFVTYAETPSREAFD